MKRYKPLRRRGRVKPVNGARKAQAFARNFGPEADALRSLPCVVASRGNGKHRCSGKLEIAHVVARGMGASNGGRFDIVPLCQKAHRNSGGNRTTKREAFELMFGVDLRAEADRLALEHERPLGLRGVADRWAVIIGELRGEAKTCMVAPYELDALAGWVTRELAREVKHRRERWGGKTSEQLVREGYAAHNDSEALSHHIADLLGGPFLEDPHGEHGLAWSLCEWATEGRWVS